VHGETRNAYKISGEKPEWRRPLVRAPCIWEYNIEMDPKEIVLV